MRIRRTGEADVELIGVVMSRGASKAQIDRKVPPGVSDRPTRWSPGDARLALDWCAPNAKRPPEEGGLFAAPASTDRCELYEWWPGAESNHRHKDFQSSALPTELPGHSREREYNKRWTQAQLLLAILFLDPVGRRITVGSRAACCKLPNCRRHSPMGNPQRRSDQDQSPLFLPSSTPSCLSLRYRWVRSSPVFSATRVMLPFSRDR